jgi:hypothetical protein
MDSGLRCTEHETRTFLPDPKNVPDVFAAGIPEQVFIILGMVLLFKMRTDLLGRNEWVELPHKSGPG